MVIQSNRNKKGGFCGLRQREYQLIEVAADAAAAAEESVETVADGDSGELLRGYIGYAELGQESGFEGGIGEVEEAGDGEAKDGIADELKALIRAVASIGGVGEGLLQQRGITEGVIKEALDLRHR